MIGMAGGDGEALLLDPPIRFRRDRPPPGRRRPPGGHRVLKARPGRVRTLSATDDPGSSTAGKLPSDCLVSADSLCDAELTARSGSRPGRGHI